MLTTLIATIFALSALIIVHEYGHYRVAVACGVKVLRFSLGFGKPLLTWKRGADQTEFVLAPIPFGGYVKMLDEREGEVDEKELHRAFNRQPLLSRMLIVAAGPVMSLVLAVLLFASVMMIGISEPRAVFGAPVAHSMLAQAGLQAGDEVVAVISAKGDVQPVASMSDLHLKLMDAAFSQEDVLLQIKTASGTTREITLPLSQIGSHNVESDFMVKIGYQGAMSYAAIVVKVFPDSQAQRAGLKAGDTVVAVDGQRVWSYQEFAAFIENAPGTQLQLDIIRDGQALRLSITPDAVEENGRSVGKIGVGLGSQAEMVTIRYGVLGSLNYGLTKTWDFSWMTLKTIGKMLVGQASVKNLSGPITIADVAGRSLRHGVVYYIQFLALISLSLGVLNLLPLPVLDGGHLMYYFYGAIRGKPVSEEWMLNFQRVGIFVLLLMMFVATFNDMTRLWGGT